MTGYEHTRASASLTSDGHVAVDNQSPVATISLGHDSEPLIQSKGSLTSKDRRT